MTDVVSKTKHFGGTTAVYKHQSKCTQTEMRFGAYLPTSARHGNQLPTLLWLSGLTCTEQNFLTKAGAQRAAEELGLLLLVPDTSPRGLDLPGEHDSYDFGSGASYYLDATQTPWSNHYNMESYITDELLSVAAELLPIDRSRLGIAGHSMGGHGALTLGLKHQDKFKSISAFSPICQPTACAWGKKAFSQYLGQNPDTWQQHDTVSLLQTHKPTAPVLVDQGSADEFLEEQLRTSALEEVIRDRDLDITVRLQEGYDHSYYFVATFIEDHLRHHSAILQ